MKGWGGGVRVVHLALLTSASPLGPNTTSATTATSTASGAPTPRNDIMMVYTTQYGMAAPGQVGRGGECPLWVIVLVWCVPCALGRRRMKSGALSSHTHKLSAFYVCRAAVSFNSRLGTKHSGSSILLPWKLLNWAGVELARHGGHRLRVLLQTAAVAVMQGTDVRQRAAWAPRIRNILPAR